MPAIGPVHGEVEIIMSAEELNPSKTNQVKRYYLRERQRCSDYFFLLEESGIFSSAVLFRRSCLAHIGYYDPSYRVFEDYGWYLRFYFMEKRALLDALPVAQYQIYDQNAVATAGSVFINQTYIAILQKQLAHLNRLGGANQYPKATSCVLAKLVCQWGIFKRFLKLSFAPLRVISQKEKFSNSVVQR